MESAVKPVIISFRRWRQDLELEASMIHSETTSQKRQPQKQVNEQKPTVGTVHVMGQGAQCPL